MDNVADINIFMLPDDSGYYNQIQNNFISIKIMIKIVYKISTF